MKVRMPSSTAVCGVRRTTAWPHPTMCIVLFAIPSMSGRLAKRLELIHDESEGVTGILRDARFDVEPTPTIQRESWYKFWANVTGHPISVLPGAHAALPRVHHPG